MRKRESAKESKKERIKEFISPKSSNYKFWGAQGSKKDKREGKIKRKEAKREKKKIKRKKERKKEKADKRERKIWLTPGNGRLIKQNC